MAKLLMISGDRSLAEGKRGAFYNTLEEFHKYWERIDVITPRPNFQFPISNFQSISNGSNFQLFGNVFLHPSPNSILLQPWYILDKGIEIYNEQKFDLITVHEYPPFYNGIGARMLFNSIHIPYLLEIMHIPGYPKPGSFKESIYKILTRWFIRFDSVKAGAIRVINKKQVPEFLLNAGVKKEKLAYIHAFYIDLEIFKPIDIPKEYDLIFIGRLVKNKGIELFIEAVKKLNCNAVIVGTGPLAEKIKLEIARPSEENTKLSAGAGNINFHGWAKDSSEVAELINKSRILVMPSYNEGGPRVILEAMACGIPVLSTPVGIATDVIEEKGGGMLIDWNSEDIARKARRILDDDTIWKKYSEEAIIAASMFEKKASIKNYAQEIKKIAKL